MENFDSEKIEQYLKGQLSPPEQKLITDRMAAEPAFAAAINLHQISMEGIEQYGLQQVKVEIAELDKELEQDGFFLTSDDLDTYIDNEATESTQKMIEQRLAKDETFKQDFELHQLTREGIENNELATEFGDLFEDIDKNLAKEGFFEELETKKETQAPKVAETAKIVRFPFRRLAIAASVAIAIFASWWVLQPNPVDPQLIYASNFAPLADELSIELEETGFVKEPFYDLLEDGIKAYNNRIVPINSNTSIDKNYREAINLFEQYRQAAPSTDEFYPTATLYLAVSHLAIGQYQQAIQLLEPLTQQDFAQQIDAQWYLALSYIKTGQKEKAVSMLEMLKQTKYQNNVLSILDQLE